MRTYLLPILGAACIIIGVVTVLANPALAKPALVLEGAGVVLLGIFLGINFARRRPRRR